VTTLSASDRIIIDSSGWVEYLGNGPKSDRFAVYFDSKAELFLPSIVVYEVQKKLLREQDSKLDTAFLSQIHGFGDRLIQLDLELAVVAAETSLKTGLAMADAIIYATAAECRAQLITSDGHFANLPRVTLI